MYTMKSNKFTFIIFLSLFYSGCVPSLVHKSENKTIPVSFKDSQDTTNTAKVKWKEYFNDSYLNLLIDTALKNNQELNIVLQEINISQNEIRARKGDYLPAVDIKASAGLDKMGRYTRLGSVDENLDVAPGKSFPTPFSDLLLAARASWEVDIWKKLRNARKAAMHRYLSSIEGRNFMITQIIAEIANAYYELMALDNQLQTLKKNIEIQQNALRIVKLEKEAAKVTELAVRKFEAEVLKNQSRQFDIMQKITETENRINFLIGRYPQPVLRHSETFIDLKPDTVYAGIPSQLLVNRPDIKQAEQDLQAAKLDIKAARANFYPSLKITAAVGYNAYNTQYFFTTPESILYYLAGDLVTPLINRNAIKAYYYSANARQIRAVYNYERTVLKAYIEVANQLANISNMQQSFNLKTQQVEALTRSIDISTTLFNSARADYMEVLMTQRDALDSKFELIETKKSQMNAKVNIYQALGGGWN